MSMDVVITQKGFMKKVLPLSIIIGDNLHYGTYDGMRINPDVIEADEIMVYNPKNIGRGFSVIWNEKEKDKVILRLLNPTLPHEVEDFFKCIQRIASYWKCELEIDGEVQSLKEFIKRKEEFIEFNDRVTKDMLNNIISGNNQNLTLYCTMFPLVIGMDEANAFINDIELFYNWINDKQQVDAYYAKPQFYKAENEIFGRYVHTENVKSIFPIKPFVPFGFINPETNKQLECDQYNVYLYSVSEDKIIGETPYETFIEYVQRNAEVFDAQNIIFDGLSLTQMKELLNGK